MRWDSFVLFADIPIWRSRLTTLKAELRMKIVRLAE